jgi:hypothetical protein
MREQDWGGAVSGGGAKSLRWCGSSTLFLGGIGAPSLLNPGMSSGDDSG